MAARQRIALNGHVDENKERVTRVSAYWAVNAKADRDAAVTLAPQAQLALRCDPW